MEYSLPLDFSFGSKAELLLWRLSDLSNNGCGFPEVPSEESSPPRNCLALHTPCLCFGIPAEEAAFIASYVVCVCCTHSPLQKTGPSWEEGSFGWQIRK